MRRFPAERARQAVWPARVHRCKADLEITATSFSGSTPIRRCWRYNRVIARLWAVGCVAPRQDFSGQALSFVGERR
jgi:hypothetical protein